jgi:6-phosphofructokinase 1
MLAFGVKKLFDDGITACVVTADQLGNVSPLYLKDVEDEHGKVKPRLVNMDVPKIQLVYNNGLQFIGENDYEAASKLVPNPEDFDFRKILNW